MPRPTFCEIGVYGAKRAVNVGTLWRSAVQLGAAGIFTIGHRFPPQGSDTLKAYRHIPWRRYLTVDEWHAALPYDVPVIGIELGGKPLRSLVHPARAVYLLGAEDHGLPPTVLAHCHQVVRIEAVCLPSYNVAVAGSIVLYHRWCQHHAAQEGP